jgi:response regulator of citrate/malate metabolism
LGGAVGGVILVVDDDPSIREALDLVLGSTSTLHMACSAEEALAMSSVVASAVEIIFLDGYLGAGPTGIQALPLLRIKFHSARIAFIGALGQLNASELRAVGVTMVLPKPWKLGDLRAAADLTFGQNF